jgi:glycosyltransferase involved in cell wall biosynthesis
VASANFLNELIDANYEVKHLTIATDKHPFHLDRYPENIAKIAEPEGFYINTKINPFNAFMAYFKRNESFNVNRFYCFEFEQLIINSIQSNSYDTVILDSLYTTIYYEAIRQIFTGKIFVRSHNVESDIWFGLSSNNKGYKRKYFARLAENLKQYEVDTLNKVDGLLTISKDDENRFKELGVHSPIKNIPIGVEASICTPKLKSPVKFVHIGAMNWKPNIEAVEFLFQVFPEIRKELPNAELHIAGTRIPGSMSSNIKNGIYIDGFVPNVHEYLSEMNILISPIQSGSGIRIKLLEAMACGIPCITSSLGALGIEHNNSNCLLVADNKEDLILKSVELGSNLDLQKEIGLNAINYIREHHNNKKISAELREFIQST